MRNHFSLGLAFVYMFSTSKKRKTRGEKKIKNSEAKEERNFFTVARTEKRKSQFFQCQIESEKNTQFVLEQATIVDVKIDRNSECDVGGLSRGNRGHLHHPLPAAQRQLESAKAEAVLQRRVVQGAHN
jgi:hypothetical protein